MPSRDMEHLSKLTAKLPLLPTLPVVPVLSVIQALVTILLIEDDSGNEQLTRTTIREASIDNPIVTFRSAVEAWEFLERLDVGVTFPFFVLLDLKTTPEMDGFEFLERLNARFAGNCLPVAILSASSNIEGMKRCAALGYPTYFIKPLDGVFLMQRLTQMGLKCRIENASAGT